MQNIIYIEMKEHVQVEKRTVTVKNVAESFVIRTQNDAAASESPKTSQLLEKIEKTVVYQFAEAQKQKNSHSDHAKFQNRYIVSRMDLIEKVNERFPQYPIVPLGETDCVVELKMQEKKKQTVWQLIKILLVCLLCVLGGAFSIMAFHNDIGITNLFGQLYELVTGADSDGFTVIEISYSIGLFAGITLFYNHLGKRRITTDPTPIEVSMRSYEKDMDQALVQEWERREKG